MFELFKYNVVKFGVIKKRLSCVSCQNTLLAGDVFSKLKVSRKKSVTCAPQWKIFAISKVSTSRLRWTKHAQSS